jgi:mannose-6-phosphate isomerase-like protein (cupin superfamily)
MSDSVVEDPILRQRYSFSRSTDEDGGEVLHVDTWIEPGGGVTPHVHPAMEERFRVLEGSAEFLSGRRWSAAGPGEEVVVPAGTRHAYRNRGAVPAHVVCDVRPPSSLQEFLEDVATLSRTGRLTRHALPNSPHSLLQAAVLAEHYRDMAELLFPPMPPRIVQRLLFPPLARLGARRGYRAGPIASR